MPVEPVKVNVSAYGDLAKLLEAASERPLVLEVDGVRYRVERERQNSHPDDYSPEAVRAMLRETAGSWADLDIDAMIDDLYRAREEGSRPTSRP